MERAKLKVINKPSLLFARIVNDQSGNNTIDDYIEEFIASMEEFCDDEGNKIRWKSYKLPVFERPFFPTNGLTKYTFDMINGCGEFFKFFDKYCKIKYVEGIKTPNYLEIEYSHQSSHIKELNGYSDSIFTITSKDCEGNKNATIFVNSRDLRTLLFCIFSQPYDKMFTSAGDMVELSPIIARDTKIELENY